MELDFMENLKFIVCTHLTKFFTYTNVSLPLGMFASHASHIYGAKFLSQNAIRVFCQHFAGLATPCSHKSAYESQCKDIRRQTKSKSICKLGGKHVRRFDLQLGIDPDIL